MSVECPFLEGVGDVQCHQVRALPRVREAIGYDGATIPEVRKDYCQSGDPSRETSCPVLKDLREAGRNSQFARPVSNIR